MSSVTIVRIEILVFVSLLFGAGDACLNTQVKETQEAHEWTLCSNQVLSLLGGFYKAKSAEAFALMKLVQVKRGFCNKM